MRYFLLLFFVILNQVSFSQDKINLGFKSGITISNWDPNSFLLDYFGYDTNYVNFSKVGFNASVFIEYQYESGFGLLGTLGFNQKGQSPYYRVHSYDVYDYSIELRNYSSLFYSLMGKYLLNDENISPFIIGGVRGELMFQKKYSGFWIDRIFNYHLFGVNAGFGFEINNILPNTMIAEILFTHDLNNHFDDDSKKTKFVTLELKLGYMFSVKL